MPASIKTCDEIARVWPDKFPRPDAETTENNGRRVRKFGRDFKYRDPESIERGEALEWALSNPQSVRYVRSMFNDFAAVLLVSEKVAETWSAMKLPKKDAEPVIVPTFAQIDTLVNLAREKGNHSLASRIVFAATVGLRFAEQQAVLKPGFALPIAGNAFIDPNGTRLGVGGVPRRMAIDWQKARTGALKRPKTKRGLRKVMVPGYAQDAVFEAVEHHSPYRERFDRFLWPESKETFRKQWSELRREARIWFKWHNLRHYCATWLLDNGATVDDVAVQLGIRPEEVRNTYGHPDRERALQRLEGLID